MSNRQQCNDFSNYPSTDARSFDPVLVNGRGIYSDVSKGEPILRPLVRFSSTQTQLFRLKADTHSPKSRVLKDEFQTG